MKQLNTVLITLYLLSTGAPSTAQIQNPKNLEFTWKTDTSVTMIDLSEMVMVLPPRSFEVLENPDFVDQKKGMEMFLRNEPVLAVFMDSAAKAYPLNILSFHEIANDELNGIPIAATYCPLCNSGLVFDRRIEYKGTEKTLSFEVSGLLRNSDMVMMDRETESWWQQLMGQAIVGALAGTELSILPSLIISVEEFFNRFPSGKILSKNTGNVRLMERYGTNYYTSYDSIGNQPMEKFFDGEDLDNRLPAMERVVNIHDGPDFKIYPFSAVAKKGVINDPFKTKNVVLFYQENTLSVLDSREIKNSKRVGSVTVFDATVEDRILTFYKSNGRFFDHETGSEWDITGYCKKGSLKGTQLDIEPHSNHFAFAWLSFYPETEIYETKK